MFLAYLLGASVFLAGIGLTVSSGWLITMAAQAPPILTLMVAIALVRFFGLARAVSRYAERLLSHKAVFDRLTKLRVDLYKHLARTSITISRKLSSSSTVKTIVDDVERAQEYQLRITLPRYAALISVGVGALLGLWIHPQTLYITLPAGFLLLLLLPKFVELVSEPLARNIETEESAYASVIEEATQGVIEASIYGYAEESRQRVKESERRVFTSEALLLNSIWKFATLVNLIISASVIAFVWLAIELKRNFDIPHVQVAMAIFLSLVLFEAVTSWYPNLLTAGKLLASQKSVDALLEIPVVELHQREFYSEVNNLSASEVSVAWGDPFMSSVNFSVDKGQTLVIRGRSGSGKSTLIMGALGFLPYEGSLTVNGAQVRDISNLHELLVGTVQHSHIFNTSLRENLKIANPSASDAQIMEVLDLVELNTMVAQMDLGIDSIIGEFGRAISGGEAKRLAVARALLSKAPVVLLDEPTEHLDYELASRLEMKIQRFCSEKILVVVTHSGWQSCDKTLIMNR